MSRFGFLPRACAFDFDGTLVDTMWGYARIAGEAMQSHLGIPFEEGHRRYLETSGIPFFQQLELIRPGEARNARCAEEFEARKIEGLFLSAPDADTLAGLTRLRAAGIRVIVSSNNFQELVEEYLRRHPALVVDLALGFDRRGLEKGRPHFLRLEEAFGLRTAEVLYCGDSLKDGERALAHGVPFVGRTGIFTRAQFLAQFPGIETVDSILELAEGVLAARVDEPRA